MRARSRTALVVVVLVFISLLVGVFAATTGSGELRGRALDEDGDPVARCDVRPEGPTFDNREGAVWTGPDGSWAWGQVRNGPYLVRVTCRDDQGTTTAEGVSSLTLVHGSTIVDVAVSATR